MCVLRVLLPLAGSVGGVLVLLVYLSNVVCPCAARDCLTVDIPRAMRCDRARVSSQPVDLATVTAIGRL